MFKMIRKIKTVKILYLASYSFIQVITWLNKELNENQLVRKQDVLGPSTTPPAHSSSNTIRSGISPNLNVVRFKTRCE